MAVVHHGLPVWPVPAIHLQAPAAPFQSPTGVWSPLGPHTHPGHQSPALPSGCGYYPLQEPWDNHQGWRYCCMQGRKSWAQHPQKGPPCWGPHGMATGMLDKGGGKRSFSSWWLCPMMLPRAQHWGRRVLGGSREGAALLPDVALDAAVAPYLVLYQVGVVR